MTDRTLKGLKVVLYENQLKKTQAIEPGEDKI